MNRSPHRIVGYDFARAMAVVGMIFINFRYMLDAYNQGPEWLITIMAFISGRAAVLFVTLAGVGLSLTARSALASADGHLLGRVRIGIAKRSLCLFLIGLLISRLWGADILRFYGVYLIVGAWVLTIPGHWLRRAGLIAAAFSLDMLLPDGYYTIRDQFLNGPMPLSYMADVLDDLAVSGHFTVFPWIGYLLAGMWLGKKKVDEDPLFLKRLLGVSFGIFLFLESGAGIIRYTVESRGFDIYEGPFYAFLISEAFPSTTLFTFSAGFFAMAVIAACLLMSPKRYEHGWTQAIAKVGQLSLTVYVTHILFGYIMTKNVVSGNDGAGDIAMAAALGYCLSAVVFAHFWLRRFDKGPLEWLMRVLSKPYRSKKRLFHAPPPTPAV